jgi:type VI secretion system protein ImpK
MSDDPFSEPDDSERTVIRPVPGGRRPAATPAPQPAAPSPFASRPAAPPVQPMAPMTAAAPMAAEGAETISFGLNPLVSAATPECRWSNCARHITRCAPA